MMSVACVARSPVEWGRKKKGKGPKGRRGPLVLEPALGNAAPVRRRQHGNGLPIQSPQMHVIAGHQQPDKGRGAIRGCSAAGLAFDAVAERFDDVFQSVIAGQSPGRCNSSGWRAPQTSFSMRSMAAETAA